MKSLLTKAAAKYRTACIKVSTRSSVFVHRNATAIMFVFGVTLLALGVHGISQAQSATGAPPAYNDTLIRGAVGSLFGLIEGAFGALIMVVAGLGAIFSAAMGAYRAAVGMLVVAVGAFILRALVSLFFGEFTETAESTTQQGGGA